MFTVCSITLALAALNAAAEAPAAPPVGHDFLTLQIMSKQLTQSNGGITGAVRIGSGEAITLHIVDPLSALKPAEGLAVKPAKARPRKKARRADEQLKTLSAEDRRADWSGRK